MRIQKNRGTYLPYKKEPMASLPLLRPDHIRQVILPIFSEYGVQCRLLLEKDSPVSQGQLLAEPLDEKGTPVYSSVSGILTDTYEAEHPLLGKTTYTIIECMTMDEPELDAPLDTEDLTAEELVAIARDYGIIDEIDGLPLANKLEGMVDLYPTCIVADAIEDQLYSCSAWATLREDYTQVLKGLRLAARAIHAAEYKIAVALTRVHETELKKEIPPEHLQTFEPDFYPHKELDDLGLAPFSIGVQACRALYRAASYKEPQTEGILTIAGPAASLPINMRVPFGTSLRVALEVCGVSDPSSEVLLGDSMTGLLLDSIDIPIVPGMTCIVGTDAVKTHASSPCLNCGRCAKVCHKHLLPYEIARRFENNQYSGIDAFHPSACDGCNACSYICPAKRNVSELVLEASTVAGVILFDWGPHHDE